MNQAQKIQISGGLARYFSFEGHAGQVVDVRVDSGNTFDTYLTLIGPDSNEVGSAEDVNDRCRTSSCRRKGPISSSCSLTSTWIRARRSQSR